MFIFIPDQESAIGYAYRRARTANVQPILYKVSIEKKSFLNLRKDDNVRKILVAFMQKLLVEADDNSLRWNEREILQNAITYVRNEEISAKNLRRITF